MPFLSSLFNHVNSRTVQVLTVILAQIQCVPQRAGPEIHSVFRIWSLPKSCHSQHTAAADRFEGHHFQILYACAHVVPFPGQIARSFCPNSLGQTMYRRSEWRQHVCWIYWEELCRDVVSRPRQGLHCLVRPHLETSLDNLSERCPGWSREGAECAARWICAKLDKANYCWTKTYEECCSDLNWATVHQRHLLLTWCQAYKIITNLDCLRFDNYFCFNQSSTRSHWLTLRCASSRIRYSFFINLPFVWNTTPFNSIFYGVSKLKLF